MSPTVSFAVLTTLDGPRAVRHRTGSNWRYQILDTPPDGALDRITAIASRLLAAPIAIVSIVDEDRIWFKSHHGLDFEQVPRKPGLCASCVIDDWESVTLGDLIGRQLSHFSPQRLRLEVRPLP